MAKVKVYNQEGKATGEVELKPELFEVVANPAVIHQVVIALQAGMRDPIAHAKGRGEVSGGGRKPWRQKGTGRARAGSSRSPLWKGGGVTFGPTKDRNFSKKVNRKVKQKALAMSLSDKVANDRFIVVESLKLPELKTKAFVDLYSKLPVSGKKTLVITGPTDKEIQRAVNNVPKVDMIGAVSLNVVAVLDHEYILLAKETIEQINKTYTDQK
ncbi:MAG: 50S ribosomal protein L4 [Candidatus Uhrbacteria bacterium]|nr:50S ribosomal protein L4 [Patescibacteria group bacterium]